MAATKRALLIGSAYDALPGTENDVKTMVSLLERFGFQTANIKTLCGDDATREKILDSWRELIRTSSIEDSVVIYYSGHGGMAELDGSEPEIRDRSNMAKEPRRLQFLVPTDYDPTLERWRGILDSEISKLLRDTTDKTPNVTYILDCCHSARLGRQPQAVDAMPKALFTPDYNRLMAHVRDLRKRKALLENDYWSNPNVVRIAAAADIESAWQYEKNSKHYVGMLTDKLNVILDRNTALSSWRSIMVGVNALVERQFAHDQEAQKPRSAGPDNRIPFSLQLDSSQAVVAEIRKDHVHIYGGRVRGISEGDTFTLTPLIPDRNSEYGMNTPADIHATTTVIQADGFDAVGSRVPKKGYVWALARRNRRRHRWPILFPQELGHIELLLQSSSDFERCESGHQALIEFRMGEEENQGAVLLFARGLQIGSRSSRANSDIEELFSAASIFAQAQNLLTLERGRDDEELTANVQINVGVVSNHVDHLKASYNTVMTSKLADIEFNAGDEYYLQIRNNGDLTIYVSVFRVDAAGKTTFVSRAWERGFRLTKERPLHSLRANNMGRRKGIPLYWPISIKPVGSVTETFVFIITTEEVDLGFLRTSSPQDYYIAREQARKGFPDGKIDTAARSIAIAYDVVRMPYRLNAPIELQEGDRTQAVEVRGEERETLDDMKEADCQPVRAANLPPPERTEEWESLSSHVQEQTAASKGLIGAAIRTLKGIPPCVWVVNEHDEEITVVVSRYRAHRMLTSGGLNASATGAGFNLETTTFTSPATTKTLSPKQRDPEGSIAVFPLWTRKDGFGVITIFTGPDKKLFIDKDMIPTGATAYFRNKANFKIVEYNAGSSE